MSPPDEMTLPTLVHVLEQRAEADSGSPAFTFFSEGASFHPPRAATDTLSYGRLRDRAAGIAREVRRLVEPGEPVVLLYPSGLEVIAALFGCIYAGCIPVPMAYQARDAAGWGRQVERVVRRSGARLILTTESLRTLAAGVFPPGCASLSTEGIPSDGGGPLWSGSGDEPAFLQFTSGSTSEPKGVVVTHANVITYTRLVDDCLGGTRRGPFANWMPHFHDGGMMAGIMQPLCSGVPSFLLAPESFVARPIRWLRMVSDSGAVVSGSPNFGYELCIRRTSADDRKGLDLSRWKVAANAAEPVRAETLDRFTEAFGPFGFEHTHHAPAYGLAEATVLATFDLRLDSVPRPDTVVVGFDDLASGVVTRVQIGSDHSVHLVGCGPPLPTLDVTIVRPGTGEQLEEGAVGEIWVSGPTVAKGYWDDPERTSERFGCTLDGPQGTQYLRTGDLGFMLDGQLYPTGRLDDVIIVRGRNLYPQDVEHVAEAAHGSLRRGRSAAFALAASGGGEFGLVLEVSSEEHDHGAVLRSVRGAVGRFFGVHPSYVALASTGTVLKTPSGKVRRHATRDLVTAGAADIVASWSADDGVDRHPT